MNLQTFISILFSLLSVSDPIQLEIIYEAQVRQVLNEEERKEFSNDDVGRAQLKATEEPPTETYKMLISSDESSFTYQDRIFNFQDQVFDIRYTPAGRGTTYHNLKDSIQLKDVGEMFGKLYYVSDSLPNWNWLITGERKKILEYDVISATTEDETAIYTAWFTPNISVSNGPAEFWGLPGLILEIEKKSKEREYNVKYKATSIKLLKKAPKIIKPHKGTKIKESDIDIILKEGRKRHQEMYSQGVETN